MKTINILKTLLVVGLTLILSTSVFAQDKLAKGKDKECCPTTTKSNCKEDCKTSGCDTAEVIEAHATHKCTSECKTVGCAIVKAKEAKATKACSTKHVCTSECKTAGCDALKVKEAKAMIHKCGDDCKEGCKA